jgi:PAS domain-containing protein
MEGLKEAVLLKLSVDGDVVREVASTGPGEYSALRGSVLAEILEPCPSSPRFALSILRFEGSVLTVAARAAGPEYFVYLLSGLSSEVCPGLAWVKLTPGKSAPLASPALVALLGYTPWELAGTDLLSPVFRECGASSFVSSVLDRWGSRKDLLCSCSRGTDGSRWITMIPLPSTEPVSLEDSLVEWERQPVGSAQAELEFLLRAAGIPCGVLIDRSVQPQKVVAESGLSLAEDDFGPGGLLTSWVSGSILWVDSEETSEERGNICVAPFGRSERYLVVLGGVPSPVPTEQRLRMLLPVLAMRLDLWTHCRSGAELEGRRALLDDFDEMLQKHEVTSWSNLQPALSQILPETGAVSAAVFAPGSAEPLAIAGESSPPSVTALFEGKGDLFQAIAEVRLRNGYRLCAGFDKEAAADQSLIRALGRMLERYCRDQSGDRCSADLVGVLPAAAVKSFRVFWQGDSMSLSHCHEYYGRSTPCEGCPLLVPAGADPPRHMTILNGETLEEIHQIQEGHLLLWLKQPQQQARILNERIPGGLAVYDREGLAILWNGWFEAATGAAPAVAVGQWAGRLLEKLGSEKLMRQFELGLKGVFLPESVEFRFEGRRCWSRLCQGPGGSLHHFVLDSVSAGLGYLRLLSGPGIVAQADPSPVASTLSDACEMLGWELDVSPTAADGSTVWLSRQALSGLLLEVLRVLAPLCPERWVSLDLAAFEKPFSSNRAFLPGEYVTMQFGTYQVLLASQQSTLGALDREMSAIGGWSARTESGDSFTLAFPAAIRLGAGECVGVYPGDEYFASVLAEVLPSVPATVRMASTLSELAAAQAECSLIVARLKPGEMDAAAALAGRAPWQGLILATGLQPQLPLFASRIDLLQLPATPEEVLSAIRRMLVV